MDTSPYRHRLQRVLNLVLVLGVAMMVAAWLLYGAFGHRIVEYVYRSDSQLVGRVLSGRAETPLRSYLDDADTLKYAMVLTTEGVKR